MMSSPIPFVLVTFLVVSCSLSPVDFDDKVCPCGPGFVCDSETNRCEGVPTCDALVSASDFRATWTTAHSVGWRWEPIGQSDDLLRYEIEFLDADGEVVETFGPESDPVLGGYFLPRTLAATDVVRGTITDRHTPESTLRARLVVTDRMLCSFRTPILAATTTMVPPESRVIFEDELEHGLTPESLRVADDPDGGSLLRWSAAEDAECIRGGGNVCSQNLQLYPANYSLLEISPGPFANTAYVELTLSYDGLTPSYYGSLRLGFGQEPRTNFSFNPFTVSATESRQIEVPLRVLSDGEGNALTTERIAELGGNLSVVAMGGQWDGVADGGVSAVTLDEIRIRY